MITEHDLKMAFDDGYQAALEDNKFQYETGFVKGFEAAYPKWISVEERLPEKSGCYLVAINCPKGRWSECNSYDHLEKRWSSEWECFREDTTELVTHWMPLPEPPEVKR